ncbi:MAG TPA: PhnD/SsuA/transferrin family substrate-binding protein [Methanospirillum sp.]|nr:PhnD/SsuA/transferrin family substrate-binding protein [Methanospirillum sp.]
MIHKISSLILPTIILTILIFVPVCASGTVESNNAPLHTELVVSGDQTSHNPDLIDSAEENQIIRIGVLANRGDEVCREEWGPTAEYLSQHLSPIRFELVPLDFNETSPAAKNRNVSFIVANPSVYTYLEYYGLATRIATLQVPGDPDPQSVFGGVIFTRIDRTDITSIKDLRGKRFAAVDQNSLGGWQAALMEIKFAGIDPVHDFAELNFTGTQDASVFAVLKGDADAGTTRSTQLERMAKENKIDLTQIKILNNQQSAHPEYPYLLSTHLYPEWPFAAVTGTAQNLSKQVSVSLLMMKSDDPAAKAVRGAGWAIPQDHTTVHQLLRELTLPPYEDYGKATVTQIIHQYWQSMLAIIAGIMGLSALLFYTWHTKQNLAHALKKVTESEIAISKSKKALEEVHEELAETQTRIMDSIHYGKLIQQSIVPSHRELSRFLPDYFILFKPLDIVGGDFYFFKDTKNGFCIATVDCTGHGVPGAFMTMMANALLTRVIETYPEEGPAFLLQKLHVLVQDTLKSQSENNHLENGLDIALCLIDMSAQKLTFAGGGLPLIISESGAIREIPGDRLHLGFSSPRKEYAFTEHQIEIRPDCHYYLLTDGVLDLPGGSHGYGLGRKGLIKLIINLAETPMKRQGDKILSVLTDYQNQYEQKDDMLIIGFSIKGKEDT